MVSIFKNRINGGNASGNGGEKAHGGNNIKSAVKSLRLLVEKTSVCETSQRLPLSSREQIMKTAFDVLKESHSLKEGEFTAVENDIAKVIAKYGEGTDKVKAFKIVMHETSQITLAKSITEPKDISAALTEITPTSSQKALVILMENFIGSGASAYKIAEMLDAQSLPPHVKVATGFLKQALSVESKAD
jgi:hypothetical protein